MDADEHRLDLNHVTEAIIAAAFQVSNTLGAGFLEKVYENALCHELVKQGLKYRNNRRSKFGTMVSSLETIVPTS